MSFIDEQTSNPRAFDNVLTKLREYEQQVRETLKGLAGPKKETKKAVPETSNPPTSDTQTVNVFEAEDSGAVKEFPYESEEKPSGLISAREIGDINEKPATVDGEESGKIQDGRTMLERLEKFLRSRRSNDTAKQKHAVTNAHEGKEGGQNLEVAENSDSFLTAEESSGGNKKAALLEEGETEKAELPKLENGTRIVFGCPHCSVTFAIEKKLRKHFKRKHFVAQIPYRIRCATCDVVYERIKFREHIDDAHRGHLRTTTFLKKDIIKQFGTKIGCPDCSLAYSSVPNLRKHYKKAHSSQGSLGIIKCTSCNKKIAISEFRNHVKVEHSELQMQHSERDKQFRNEDSIVKNSVQKKDATPLSSSFNRCPVCDKSCRNVKTHLRVHKKIKCTMCGMFFSDKRNLKNHINIFHNQSMIKRPTFECTICKKPLCSRTSLRKHVKYSHLNQRPFECPLCQSKFAEKAKMERHVAAIHEGQKPYKCEHCGKRVSLRFNLKQHILEVHGGNVKPFKCDICKRTFKLKAALRRHTERVHMKLKFFQCDICPKDFYCKGDLLDHKSKMHKNAF